ncbi:hypothetical protein A5844_001737 [Enterococcus sp. 10A9_DIV0425]|uniref:V-type ATPase, subunit F n=1 Tax=Candidatus Enterococcus wittei TaxID=1987383 RepID=A0A242JXU8_9ENTE|nr:hypothetical protein A5844_001737 [Enterococcus sp. 10A9_DIV0425]
MLEALEKIQKAEEMNERTFQELRQELRSYEKVKEDELEKLQDSQRLQLARMIEEKTDFEKQQVTREKEELAKEAHKLQMIVQEQYQKYRKEAVEAIIERVKETYGRH